jgi:hypothetical protein
MIRE